MNKLIKRSNFFTNKGFSIIEVIIACTIISVSILALISTATKGVELSNRALKQSEAITLLEEGVEAVKSIRDNDWNSISSLSLDTDYYLFFDTTANIWTLNNSLDTPNGFVPIYPIDGNFNRTVKLSLVNRDSNDDIASMGTLDDRTKKVTVTVSWISSSGTISKNLVFYLMDIFN